MARRGWPWYGLAGRSEAGHGEAWTLDGLTERVNLTRPGLLAHWTGPEYPGRLLPGRTRLWPRAAHEASTTSRCTTGVGSVWSGHPIRRGAELHWSPKPAAVGSTPTAGAIGRVAQSVERLVEAQRVGGSTPSPSTIAGAWEGSGVS